ncbi:hypothetical protein GGR55DRAFT_344940 [Xylaria sp. FL0064]|nr:hypothetical protein GGR55DRAFT_344940 [Xylaria sp. FL0064]
MRLHKKLDWKQMIERLKSPYLRFENHMVQETLDPTRILFHTQPFLEPKDRMDVFHELLPSVDTAHLDTQEGAQVSKLITAMIPTAPAPESCSDCQPATILPMLFELFAMQKYSYQVTVQYIYLFSRLAESHLGCDHVPFGPYGIYDRAQSDTIFNAIFRLMLLDNNGKDVFTDPPIPSSAPYHPGTYPQQSFSPKRLMGLSTCYNLALWKNDAVRPARSNGIYKCPPKCDI